MRKIADIFVKLFKSGWYKYIIAVILFVVAIVFSQKHNIRQYMDNLRTIDALEKEKAYYESEIEKNRSRLQELKSDKNNIEKFARERYHLKKADEDVFVVEEE